MRRLLLAATVLMLPVDAMSASMGPLHAGRISKHVECGWKTDSSGHEYHSCWFLY